MEPYLDLGTYARGTSTASASAQTWFDRGLIWSYAFDHEEAIRCDTAQPVRTMSRSHAGS